MGEVWRECGYADFADGTFGNGGQNLYVSRAGVLQRIFRFDVNGDGYTDILFVNSQDMDERPPLYVCTEPLGHRLISELPTQGAYAGAIADLNGDGYDDLVVGHQHNGTHSDLTAYIYYGGPEGLSERHKVELPAPNCRAVAIGDFDGDGRPDLAFSCEGRLRIVYQADRGFVAGSFVDLDLEVTHLAAGDLDGDGTAELYVRVRQDRPRVLWGGPGGIDLRRCTVVGGEDGSADALPASTPGRMQVADGWRSCIVRLNGRPNLFRPEGGQACFYPVLDDQRLGAPLRLTCADVVAAAAADINGDGRDELVLAVCPAGSEPTSSWIYWGTEHGFSDQRRTALPTLNARDVALADLNGDGFADIVVGQGRTDVLNTTESLIFRGCATGVEREPVRITTHDATTALIGRTSTHPYPQVIVINHEGGRVRGDVPAYVYYGGPDGFAPDRRDELPGWSAPAAACCDFNDDGWADILICNCAENAPHLDPGSFLYWGGPTGFQADHKQVIPTIRAHGCAVGDFRHSGYLDLAVVGFYNPELLIFRGGPQGLDLERPQRIIMDPTLKEFTPGREVNGDESTPGADYREPRWLLAADFNNDGWLDLFVSQCMGQHCFLLWGGPAGFSMERATRLLAEGGICAQAADLTRNGWLDLIIGGHQCLSKRWRFDSYIYIYWGGPAGFREDRRAQLPTHTCNALAVADFNNDGVLDIFGTSYNAGRDRDLDAYLYWGAPGGHYTAANVTRLFAHSSCGCLAADFDEDGWIDLAIANHKTYGNHVGSSHIWWNGPQGFSEQRRTLLPTLGPHGMLAVDPGNIMDRGPEEYYSSSAFELPAGARVTSIRWQAELQAKTWVRAQLRFALAREELTRAAWQGPDGSNEWFDNGQSAGQLLQTGHWLQYRLALGALNGGTSPRVTAVEIEYERGHT